LQPEQTVILNAITLLRWAGQVGEVSTERSKRELRGLFLIPGLWDMARASGFRRLVSGRAGYFAAAFCGKRDLPACGTWAASLTLSKDGATKLKGTACSGAYLQFGPMLDGPKPRFPSSVAIATPETHIAPSRI